MTAKLTIAFSDEVLEALRASKSITSRSRFVWRVRADAVEAAAATNRARAACRLG
jgi:hypothetical protein